MVPNAQAAVAVEGIGAASVRLGRASGGAAARYVAGCGLPSYMGQGVWPGTV